MEASNLTDPLPVSPIGVRLVLGSGGIKPIAGAPLLAFLDRLGVGVDEVVGCSGGAVVAALYATGMNGEEVRRTISELLRPQLFGAIDYGAPLGALGFLAGVRGRRGLLRPDRIQSMYREVFGSSRIEALPRRLLLQATDFLTSQPAVLEAGPVAAALYASMAAYPLLPPIELDGRWLVDGAFSAPLPLHASARPARLTVAVSVNQTPTASLADRLLGLQDEPACAFTPLAANDDAVGRLLVVRMPIARSVRWWDTHLLPELFAAGERAVMQHGAAIAAALAGAGQSPGGAIQLCKPMPPSTTTVVPVT
jgi:NTE family protein